MPDIWTKILGDCIKGFVNTHNIINHFKVLVYTSWLKIKIIYTNTVQQIHSWGHSVLSMGNTFVGIQFLPQLWSNSPPLGPSDLSNLPLLL